MKSLVRLFLLFSCILAAILYYNYTQAKLVLSGEGVPSLTNFQMLQYCFQDSDCQIVRWHDCNQCQYARAVNQRWADYFYDNADYYQYPIGFNTYYCQALKKIASTVDEVKSFKTSCEFEVKSEEVVTSACDQFIKQCYALCHDSVGRTHRCVFDSYLGRFVDRYLKLPVVTSS